MPVEKALSYDDEERVGFRRGGRGGSRRGGGFGRRGGKAGRSRSRAQRRSKSRQRKGPRSRGLKRTQDFKKTAKGKAAVARGRQKAAERKAAATPSQRQPGLEMTNEQKAAQDAYNKRTGFQTKDGGYLRDSKGNIVRSGTQVERVAAERERARALSKIPGITTMAAPGKPKTARDIEADLKRLRTRLGASGAPKADLDRLVGINRALGDSPYAGMSLGNQFRTQGADLIAGIPGLAKVASAVAGGPAGIAGLVASGGRGIGNLVFDALGRQQSERQPNLAESQDDAQGGLQSLLAGLRIGEGAPFVEDRGGRQDERVIRTGPSLMSPPPTTDSLFGKTIKKLPITTQPVDTNIMNQYLALAGFSPQEIQGMPSAFRFLG